MMLKILEIPISALSSKAPPGLSRLPAPELIRRINISCPSGPAVWWRRRPPIDRQIAEKEGEYRPLRSG